MSEIELRMKIGSALAAIRQMAQGKRLMLPDGRVVGMGDDASVGFVSQLQDGERVTGSLTVKDVIELMEQHGLGPVIGG